MQSDECPSCMVELPPKPHSGSSPSEGKVSNSLICVLPPQIERGRISVEPNVLELQVAARGFGGRRDEVRVAEPFVAPRAIKIVNGAWYHEEAVQDARRGNVR
jgi:hypothetical protein